MNSIIEGLNSIVQAHFLLIAIALVVVVFGGWRMCRARRKKQILARLQECDIQLNELRSAPIEMKINKAISLSRHKAEYQAIVQECQRENELIKLQTNETYNNIVQCEEAIHEHRFREALGFLEEIEYTLRQLASKVEQNDRCLEQVLLEEEDLRKQITHLKTLFLRQKQEMAQCVQEYHQLSAFFEKQIGELENNFKSFEEWAGVHDCQRLQTLVDEIGDQLQRNALYIRDIPQFLHLMNGEMYELSNTIWEQYQGVKDQVNLQFLQVEQFFAELEHNANVCFQGLLEGHFHGFDRLSKMMEHLRTLGQKLQVEIEAQGQIAPLMENIAHLITAQGATLQQMEELYQRNRFRFALLEYQEDLQDFRHKYDEIVTTFEDLKNTYEQETTIASVFLGTIQEVEATLTTLAKRVQMIEDNIIVPDQLEQWVVREVRKLFIVVNEMAVRVRESGFPQLESQYQGEFASSWERLGAFEQALQGELVEINKIKTEVENFRQVIFRLYETVNHQLKTVDLAEEIIIFGNLYRDLSRDFDSMMTRAELFFRNGEYDLSLSLSISALKRLSPQLYQEFTESKASS